MAISADGESWFLLNASPEIRAQIESFAPLHPRAPRHSPIAGIVLTNGDLDHCLGLLSLRESYPLRVYATAAVRQGWVEGNVLHRTLQRFPTQLTWHTLELGQRAALVSADGKDSGLWLQPLSAAGKLPIHLEGRAQASAEDNVGLLIHEPARAKTLAYFPAAAGATPELRATLADTDCIFFDGTFWSSDELPALGLGEKRAEDMAHWPIGGTSGSLAFLAGFAHKRRILIHINNTNPLLMEDAPQRAALRAVGVELAYDGLELTL